MPPALSRTSDSPENYDLYVITCGCGIICIVLGCMKMMSGLDREDRGCYLAATGLSVILASIFLSISPNTHRLHYLCFGLCMLGILIAIGAAVVDLFGWCIHGEIRSNKATRIMLGGTGTFLSSCVLKLLLHIVV